MCQNFAALNPYIPSLIVLWIQRNEFFFDYTKYLNDAEYILIYNVNLRYDKIKNIKSRVKLHFR